MMKKLALLLAMSGISFMANGAKLLVEATSHEDSMFVTGYGGGGTTHYDITCKIYDNGKVNVDLIQFDYDPNHPYVPELFVDPKLKQNIKTIISTNTTFKIDKVFLNESIDEAILNEETFPGGKSDFDVVVYKNKKKLEIRERPTKTKKLNIAVRAMCNQHGMRQAIVGYDR